MALLLVATTKGMKAINDQIAGGRVIRFLYAGLSDQFSSLSSDRSALSNERERFPIAVSRPAQSRIAIEARIESRLSYPIREIGIYIEGDSPNAPVLVGISGTPEPFAFASPESSFIINGFLEVAALSAPNVEITGPGERLDLTLGNEFTKYSRLLIDLQGYVIDLEQRLSALERRQ